MFQNRNQKTAVQLAVRSLKSSSMRNLLVVITIVLSVGLLSVMAFSYSAAQVKEQKDAAMMQHVIYHQVNQEQIQALRQQKEIEFLTLNKMGGGVEIDGILLRMAYFEKDTAPIRTYILLEGNMPEEMNEIAIAKSYLEKIGKDAVLGQTLTISFLDGTEETFVITGYLDAEEDADLYTIICSERYAKEGMQLKNMPYDALVRIRGAEEMSESEFLSVIRDIGYRCGIERKNINENNYFSNQLSMSLQERSVLLGVSAGILLVSFLVIYSVFYISVVSRIRQFGQLRTLGASKRQLRRMVNTEGVILCMVGSAVGICIGGAIAYGIQPFGFTWADAAKCTVLILCADLITVFISVHKPAKIASGVSPIEAVRYDAAAVSSGGRSREKGHKLNPFSLAEMSFERNKKKSFLTMISMGLAGILYMMGSTFLVSTNQEEYSRQGLFSIGEFIIGFSYNATQVQEHDFSDLQVNNPMTEELRQEILSLSGVTDVKRITAARVQYEYKMAAEYDSMTEFSREDAKDWQKYVEEGELDYEKMKENHQIAIILNDLVDEIYGWRFEVGDAVLLRTWDGEKEVEEEYIVGAIISDRCPVITWSGGLFLMPQEELEHFTNHLNLTKYMVIATESEDVWNAVENEVDAMLTENLSMSTLSNRMEQDKDTFLMLYMTILGLAGFIIAFSFINLINTLVTNIWSRRQELAMMQSIGMSQRQLISMVKWEGILLGGINLLITGVIGTTGGYILMKCMQNIGVDYFHYQFPIWYFVLYIIITMSATVFISSRVVKLLNRHTLVERIREAE